ncbi:MAG: hypothetical protein IPG85_04300 [Bacteroidetes bacterium]|nr:hypothetical protein [Bacteroidota bacterium]
MNFNFKYSRRMILTLQFLLLFSMISKSQITIKNTSLVDSDKRIIYIGVFNKIEISGLNKNDKIIFKQSICKIEKSNVKENEFLIFANRCGKDTLQVLNNDKIIYQQVYIIQNIEDPICLFPNALDNVASRIELISRPYLICTIPNNFLKVNFEITSFKVSSIHKEDTMELYQPSEIFFCQDTTDVYDSKTGETKTIITTKECNFKKNFGNQLTQYQIDKIHELDFEDKLLISEIRVRMPDGGSAKFDGLVIKIK